MSLVRVSKATFRIEIIALAVILVLVGVLAAVALRPPPARVDVTSVTWSSSGQELSTGRGWNTTAGSQATLVLSITNFGGPIDFTSATLNESVFRVVSTSLPVIAPGATGNLTVTVAVPTTSYTGPLDIVLA